MLSAKKKTFLSGFSTIHHQREYDSKILAKKSSEAENCFFFFISITLNLALKNVVRIKKSVHFKSVFKDLWFTPNYF